MSLIFVLWVLLAAVLLSTLTQGWVRHVYHQSKQQKSASGLSARDFAQSLLDENGLNQVSVVTTENMLDDRYDPHAQVLYSSTPASQSVAALAITAHEVAHALQHEESFWALKLRRWILPVSHLIAALALIAMLVGWFIAYEDAIFIGALAYLGTVILLLCALPVELDANRRALQMLNQDSVLSGKEIKTANRVLQAAVLTYVGAAFSPVIHTLFNR